MTVAPEDFIGIHQLLALYGNIVDGKQWRRTDELFVKDGVFDMTAFDPAMTFVRRIVTSGY